MRSRPEETEPLVSAVDGRPTVALSVDMTCSAARTALSHGAWGILHAGDAIIGLVSTEEIDAIERAGPSTLGEGAHLLPPVVLASSEETFLTLLASEAVVLLELNPHGLVVTGNAEVIGIVPMATVYEYAATSPGLSRTRMEADPVDADLAGRPTVARAVVCCAEPFCGYQNTLVFYDPDDVPDCANPVGSPHRLKLT